MIEIICEDLFKSKAQTLTNAVNCKGVMGKGIALDFKRKFPSMYQDYVERCNQGQMRLGQPYLYKSADAPWVLNFPTKGHWRTPSRLEDIDAGLKYLTEHYEEWGIISLALPALGCGLGDLSWNAVREVVEQHLGELDLPVKLYAPQ